MGPPALVLLGGLTLADPARAAPPPVPEEGTVTLTLGEAIELALVRSYALRNARYDERDAEQQIRTAWGSVLPRLDASANYTRTLEANDPFAGTGAGAGFANFGAIGWLAFNESARNDADPTTVPLSFEEYNRRTNAGLAAAGVDVDTNRNLFLVENRFRFGLTLTQVLYDDAAFAGLEASDLARSVARVGIDVQSRLVVRDVATAFYGALLSARQTEVAKLSVERSRANVVETTRRVEQGLLAPFQLLTAEVELANLETSLARAETNAKNAVERLRLVVGLPQGTSVLVRGELELENGALVTATPEQSVATAFEERPDLEQAGLLVRANEVQERVAFSRLLPRLTASANLAANGAVPDDRSSTQSTRNGADPFEVRRTESGFFDGAFWFTTLDITVDLTWNLFDGFANYARIEQARIATERARTRLEESRLAVRLEVEQALRELATAQKQIESQTRIRDRAELNYQQVDIRVREGVSTQFDLRQASQQLDESRFNRLQAVHDYLVARVGYLVAVGTPPRP